jgi:diphthamide biosynthesis methyltransferase
MLYFIGLGLGDAKDITVKGLEIVKKCSKVYLVRPLNYSEKFLKESLWRLIDLITLTVTGIFYIRISDPLH